MADPESGGQRSLHVGHDPAQIAPAGVRRGGVRPGEAIAGQRLVHLEESVCGARVGVVRAGESEVDELLDAELRHHGGGIALRAAAPAPAASRRDGAPRRRDRQLPGVPERIGDAPPPPPGRCSRR